MSEKKWRRHGPDLGFSPRVMLHLPSITLGVDIYLDRRTGIFWKRITGSAMDTNPTSWSWYRPPKIKQGSKAT